LPPIRTRPRCVLLERRKRVITKPAATESAATALWLRPLLKSTEVEELRRGGSDNAEHHPHRDGKRDQRASLGKDAQVPWHALGVHKNLPRRKLALRLCDESQIAVKCVPSVRTKRSNSPCPLRVPTTDIGTAEGIKQRSFRLSPGLLGSGRYFTSPGDRFCRVAGKLIGVLIVIALRRAAVHPARTVGHRWRLAQPPFACSRSARFRPVHDQVTGVDSPTRISPPSMLRWSA
jgi:hypothetical protein